MAKKNKKNSKEDVIENNNVVVKEELEVGDILSEMENSITVDRAVNKEKSISDLFSYKKCIDILTIHYNNLLTIRERNSEEYRDALNRLNVIKRKEEKLMEIIEEMVKNLEL